MRKLLVCICALLASQMVKAQDPHFSQFFASPLTLNPAFTGKFSGTWRLAANHRDQWPSIPKAYVTTSASLDFPILKGKIPDSDVFGVGLSGLTDASANNILKLNYGSVSMSYHKALDENGYSTIGAGRGAGRRKDPPDPGGQPRPGAGPDPGRAAAGAAKRAEKIGRAHV